MLSRNVRYYQYPIQAALLTWILHSYSGYHEIADRRYNHSMVALGCEEIFGDVASVNHRPGLSEARAQIIEHCSSLSHCPLGLFRSTSYPIKDQYK